MQRKGFHSVPFISVLHSSHNFLWCESNGFLLLCNSNVIFPFSFFPHSVVCLFLQRLVVRTDSEEGVFVTSAFAGGKVPLRSPFAACFQFRLRWRGWDFE